MRLLRITRAQLAALQPQLEALEHLAEYPLGEDAFRISHGRDYFAFFERLGELYYFALEEGGVLVAVGCGMVRPAEGALPRRWYAADLKVHPDWRGRHLPMRMLRGLFLQNYLRCPRGYGVAMDPADGREPPALRSFRHFPWLARATSTRMFPLDLWAADAEGMSRALPILIAARGAPRFLSLAGVKDLLLRSTGAPMPLLHLSWSARPAPAVLDAPREGHTHMWCTPRASRLRAPLIDAGFAPTATATVITHRLPGFDGEEIETAEI